MFVRVTTAIGVTCKKQVNVIRRQKTRAAELVVTYDVAEAIKENILPPSRRGWHRSIEQRCINVSIKHTYINIHFILFHYFLS